MTTKRLTDTQLKLSVISAVKKLNVLNSAIKSTLYTFTDEFDMHLREGLKDYVYLNDLEVLIEHLDEDINENN